jgi:hypothetical protein
LYYIGSINPDRNLLLWDALEALLQKLPVSVMTCD